MTSLIQSLLRPDAYPHAVAKITLLETHISWVILTGPFAYKIKKPIKLEFLDFSSLQQRKHFCDIELTLNRRWTPELYLDVVPIRENGVHATIGGTGRLIDYAVKMKQFPQSARLDAQLDAGTLDQQDMRSFAETLSIQHQQAGIVVPDDARGVLEYIRQPMLENFEHLSRCANSTAVQRLECWTTKKLRRLQTALLARQRDGFIRECHGDLHLANLVRLDSGIRAFDCVEFSATLRNIDVISDVAFLVMDLVARQRVDLAYQFLNRYLELSGDYMAMKVFDLYFVYHCLIRAKVAAIRSSERIDPDHAKQDMDEVSHYLAVAEICVARPFPKLVAMHGFSGSGKTWVSEQLMNTLPAIRLRSDIERKRRRELGEAYRSHSGIGHGIYTATDSVETYDRLRLLATVLMIAGHSVVVDAAFLALDERQKLEFSAERLGVALVFVDTRASDVELKHRLQRRAHRGNDASEADLAVLRHQQRTADEFTKTERDAVITVLSDDTFDIGSLVQRIRQGGNSHSQRRKSVA